MISQISDRGRLRHLLTLADLDRDQIQMIIDRATTYLTTVGQPPAHDTLLRGITVANLFFEASTRTRASFELAAKRLSADVLNLDVNTSSRAKGESIMDTIYTLQAMQIDMFVVRDASTGVPAMIAQHVEPHVCVLNAGESEVSHPTQGLLDLMTILQHRPDVENLCVAIVGDIRHSRVARSASRRFPENTTRAGGVRDPGRGLRRRPQPWRPRWRRPCPPRWSSRCFRCLGGLTVPCRARLPRLLDSLAFLVLYPHDAT